jgi:hypothetical protein
LYFAFTNVFYNLHQIYYILLKALGLQAEENPRTMNLVLQKILNQLLILAIPLWVTAQTSIVLETVEGTPIEYNFSSSPMSPGTLIAPTRGVHAITTAGGFNNYKLTYTPNSGYLGQDFIRISRWTCPIVSQCYQYLDFYISVVPARVIARQDNAITNFNAPVSVNVLSNDYSSRGVLVLNSISSVNNGTATFTPGSPNITFTPKPDFSGVALLNYIVCDDENNCDNGTVSVHVRPQQPVSSDTVRVFTHRNKPQVLLIPPGFQRVAGPSSGVYGSTDGDLPLYTPNNNFTGTDIIRYTDGSRQLVTVINVLNTTFNLFAFDDLAYTTPGIPVEMNVLENDAFGTAAIQFAITKQPNHGSLVLGPGNGMVTYFPNPGFTGTDDFRYVSRRPFGASNLETATARVVVNRYEPLATTYNMVTPKRTPLIIGNNIPVNNFRFLVTDQPDHGQVLFLQGQVDTTFMGQPIQGYNLIVYLPNNTINQGTDEFELAYCIANTSGPGCSFMRSVKILVNILNIGTGNTPQCFADCIWPGDANLDGVVNMDDLLPIGLYMGEAGLPRTDPVPGVWYGKQSANWQNPFIDSDVDLKHLDADGNGYISSLDTIAIHNFYGHTHGITASNLYQSDQRIGLTGNIFANPGDVVELNMILGTPTRPATNIYGFSFPFNYNPQIFDANSVRVDYHHNSWLAYNSPILFMNRNFASSGRMETGFTRTTGVPSSGHGNIGRVRFVIRDDLVGVRLGSDELQVEVGGGFATMMDHSGQLSSVDIETATITIRYDQPAFDESLLKVWPNPASDYLNIHLNGRKYFQEIILYNLTGQVVYTSGNMEANNAQIPVQQLAQGLYILSVRTAEGVINKKIDVIRP